ncbi:hypothetical protein BKA66DRAFT_562105 [Pyrenochaeta sp. MPI-SDFR-AT-0127]|nr:hypothetical protein BKA66DRAFT_562105 [Pyrenochaeta sp. MPI-SDFR-AT-0127]
MRLLQLQGTGGFSLAEFLGDNVPPYAILSHTWGSSREEVTYQDLLNGAGKEKLGHRKLAFCGEQAAKDGLNYFWIDTCCIDKSSSAELSEAITSMFRWYRDSTQCYVFLSDVSIGKRKADYDMFSSTWESGFRTSKWFTRGWTLQELIAPTLVKFFSKEGKQLGDKWSLEKTISEITHIPVVALRNAPLHNFKVEERMTWAKNRLTTREEDEAYSLLGIFDVSMLPNYGEGKERALKRLQKKIHGSSRVAATALPQDDSQHNSIRNVLLSRIHRWLCAPDPSVNYQKALKQRQHDTGLWFLEGEQYANWKKDSASSLWLYGIPGCGKTILSSAILQDVLQHCDESPGYVTAYFYFDFNDMEKQNAELMLRSLICQLARQAVDVPTSLDTLFSSHENGKRQPSLDALLQVACRTMQQLPQVYIMLDALDECAQRKELTEMIEAIVGWQLSNVHLIVTSRRERDIEISLKGFIDSQNSINLQSEVVDKDIQQYIRQRLSDDRGLRKWGKDAALWQEIETALMKGSKGMHLDMLGKCRNRAMLRKALAVLPPTLDKTYDHILSAINEEDSEYAIRILSWLAFSLRPLTVDEVAEVIAIDVTRDPAFNREEVLEDPLDALDICSSLVTTSTDNNNGSLKPARQVVVLAHYSIKEYLVSDRIQKGHAARYSMQAAVCHSLIARACLDYLGQFQMTEPMPVGTLRKSKLAQYSADFWMSHAQRAGDRVTETSRAVLHLMSRDNAAYLNWIRIHDPDVTYFEQDFQRKLESTPTPLYYAALFGLEEAVKLLLEYGADVNAQGGRYSSALQAASANGYEAVVELLLEKGADINAQGKFFSNALQVASAEGHEVVVELLLEKGADINAQGGIYDTALQAASSRGHEVVVELLLEKGADINAQGGLYDHALQAASVKGHKVVVDLLLEKGADINAQGGKYDNALQAASAYGHKVVVDLLLKKGADINAQGGHYGSALQAASAYGHKTIVKLLTDHGAII